MKILWILNMVLPSVAKELNFKTSSSGGWLVDYANKLSVDENFKLATMTYANVPSYIEKDVNGIKNYIFPGGGKRLLFTSKKTLKDLKKVIDDFKPDLIHVHGTEYSMAYSLVQLHLNIPILVTIQGILTRISKEYYAGLSRKELWKTTTIKEWIKGKTVFTAKWLFLRNAKRERKVLKNVKYVTGRTSWDRSLMLSINPNLKYYRHNYNLREEFYNQPLWQVDNAEPYTIYCGAATYPLKGLHIILKALAIVKDQYPQIKLKIPGHSISNGKVVANNGYTKFILKMIKELNLENNVEFVGRLTSLKVVDTLQSSRMVIVSSAMEGASATICEAMMIGTPCICTYRGGMTSLLHDGESGFYYDFEEYPVLADRIIKLLNNDDLCTKFSKNAHEDACIRHNREKNYTKLTEIYEDILKKEGDKL